MVWRVIWASIGFISEAELDFFFLSLGTWSRVAA